MLASGFYHEIGLPIKMRFLELKKNLKKDFSSHKKIRIALLGDNSTQFLAVALKGYGFEIGYDLEIFESDYNQIDLQILDDTSELYRFSPDVIVIFQSSQKLVKSFYTLDSAGKSQFANEEIQHIANLTRTLNASNQSFKVVCMNFAEIDDSVFGNYSNKTSLSFQYQLRKLNCELMDLSQEIKNMFICDLSSLQNRYGSNMIFDPRLYIDAEMVFSLDFLPMVAKSLLEIIQCLFGVFKKCLILDLDNTLWGGVVGDEGIENIQIGDFGQGKAFSELQQWAKQLKQRGIILAVCSKNDEKIAKAPFESHPDMELSLDDFAIFVANWDSKVDNIKYIRSSLNIGYDSMVFLDDNAFERNVVRAHLPEINVPELPADPAEYLPYLKSLNLFETSSFTEDDEGRTKQLQEEAKRVMVQKTFTSENNFLASLEMVCEIKAFDNFNIPRVAQLIQRSNQFNLRTIRHTEEDLKRFVQSENSFHFAFSLKDKYGDHGLISALILHKQNDSLFIDTWIMSCRVLRRGVENLVLNTVVNIARKEGYLSIMGEYLPTPKNELVREHFLKLGFNDIGRGLWELNVMSYIDKENFIKMR